MIQIGAGLLDTRLKHTIKCVRRDRCAREVTGSNPVLTTKFRINYPEIMEGSKLPIDYGVKAHSELSRSVDRKERGIKVRILINQQNN